MEDTYMSTNGTARSLMQFNLSYADSKGSQRLIGFGKTELINTLRRKQSSIFIDATFSCCPKGFHQCLIVSTFLESDNLFLPCFYILMTRKNKLAYVMALSALNNLFGGSIDPKYVMHDFEIAMCQAIEELWPGSRSVGCFFHFKQCLTRQMIKCGIPQHIAFRDVAWFDLMTVVPKDEIWD